MKANRIIIAIVCCCSFIFQSCPPQDIPIVPEIIYEFDVKASVSPLKKSYNVGDVIWFSASFPKTYKDSLEKQFNLPDFGSFSQDMDVGVVEIGIFYEKQQYGIQEAVNRFNYIEEKGTYYPVIGAAGEVYYRVFSYSYNESKSEFEIKTGFVCKSKGIYALRFPDLGTYSWENSDNKIGNGRLVYSEKVSGFGYDIVEHLELFNRENIATQYFFFEVK